jgi:hypothetical protein
MRSNYPPMYCNDYDEEILAIPCPECGAAASAKCLGPKPGGMGGRMWLPSPHPSRVLAAHDREQGSIWG